MHIHFDCFSGISGDMTLGAFVDLGVPVDWLRRKLAEVLPPDAFAIEESAVTRNGIRSCDIIVSAEEEQHARDYRQIKKLVVDSRLPEAVKQTSLDIFQKIAEAEAEIHGRSIDEVHFHEVGGIDAIVDIVGTALCVDYLKISSVTSSPLPLGSGFVKCQHGTLPVPAPATVKILAGIPVYGTDIRGELVTPTGAGIIATLAESYGSMPELVVEKIGYGAGKKEFESHPNLLRLLFGRRPVAADASHEDVVIIETCIDDMNPELFGYLMERLFDDGALDVYWIPVYMKKNRPGTLVQVLGRAAQRAALIDRILSETTTTGVRYYPANRHTLAREVVEMETSYGLLPAKKIVDPDGNYRWVPEYEACRKIARETETPIRRVYNTILKELG